MRGHARKHMGVCIKCGKAAKHVPAIISAYPNTKYA